jgi:hypothetical protein
MPEQRKININGPINIIRLEGKINNISKIMYLFMDIHQPVTNQTECDDIFSKDVDKYLVDVFSKINTNKTIDLFVEQHPTNVSMNRNNEYKNKYIQNINKFFSKSFKKDKKKVITNKLFPSIRFHHMDPRDYINIGDGFEQVTNTLNIIYKDKYFILSDITYLLDDFKKINKNINNLNDKLFKLKDIKINKNKKQLSPSVDEQNKMTNKDRDDLALDIIRKIRFDYNNKDVMKSINNILNSDVKNKFKEYYELYTTLENKLIEIKNSIISPRQLNEKFHYGTPRNKTLKYISEILIIKSDLQICSMDLLVFVMDLYVMRRLLDKDYITHVVAYTGAFHSANYIYYLVKYFDFKVTHSYYSKELDSKDSDINIIIKNSNNINQIEQLFYPPILKQCSELTNFPPNFD